MVMRKKRIDTADVAVSPLDFCSLFPVSWYGAGYRVDIMELA